MVLTLTIKVSVTSHLELVKKNLHSLFWSLNLEHNMSYWATILVKLFTLAQHGIEMTKCA